MKLAIISDAHLFQSFMKNYDPLYDFKSVLQRIKDESNPYAILIAGDMFDYKKTTSTYPPMKILHSTEHYLPFLGGVEVYTR